MTDAATIARILVNLRSNESPANGSCQRVPGNWSAAKATRPLLRGRVAAAKIPRKTAPRQRPPGHWLLAKSLGKLLRGKGHQAIGCWPNPWENYSAAEATRPPDHCSAAEATRPL